MNSIGEQLAQVKRELDGLDQVDLTDAPHDTVRYGSVVVTDRHHLLIATSIDGFDGGRGVPGTEHQGPTVPGPEREEGRGVRAGERQHLHHQAGLLSMDLTRSASARGGASGVRQGRGVRRRPAHLLHLFGGEQGEQTISRSPPGCSWWSPDPTSQAGGAGPDTVKTPCARC